MWLLSKKMSVEPFWLLSTGQGRVAKISMTFCTSDERKRLISFVTTLYMTRRSHKKEFTSEDVSKVGPACKRSRHLARPALWLLIPYFVVRRAGGSSGGEHCDARLSLFVLFAARVI